jgi:hypothetical protein
MGGRAQGLRGGRQWGSERNKGTKEIFHLITAKNVTYSLTENKWHIYKAQRTASKLMLKRN